MVVAQPHDCNIGQTGGCDNLVQFGHEYRDQMPEFDCSAFFISFGGYLSVSRTESCEYELLYICKVVSQ